MDRYRWGKWARVVAVSAVFLLLVCPQWGWSQQRDRVTVKWSWLYTPNVAPVFAGIEKGFFQAEGIDLDFQEGRGSVSNFQLLAANKIPAAFVDLSSVAQFFTKDTAVTAVYCYFQTSPMSIIYYADLGIRTPKDLEGKKMAYVPGSASESVFPAFAKRNGVEMSKIQVVTVTNAARVTAMLNRDVHFAAAFFSDSVPLFRRRGAKVDFFKYADYGVNVLGQGIAVHDSFIRGKPDALRRFLRALSRSVQASIQSPDAAISALKKAAPLTVKDREFAREVLANALTLLHTANTKGKPLGWMAREDWQQTLDVLKGYGGLKDPLPFEKYYTNEFISPLSGG